MTNNVEKLNNKRATLDSCQTNRIIPSKRTSRIIIAVAISIYLLLILFRQEALVGGSFAGLAFISFVVGFPLVTLYYSATYFRRAENAAKVKIFIIGSSSAIVIISIIVFSPFLTPHLMMLIPPVAVAIAIVTYAVSFDRGFRLGRVSIIVLIILFMMMLPQWLSRTLPYVYTPPALTSDRLLTYNQCIQFVKEHDEHKDITLFRWGWFSEMNKGVPKDESSEMKALWSRLSKELRALKFQKTQRDGNMLLFYNNANSILPVPPGVLYSLDGENPNTIDSELLNASKPFIRISGDWYLSRRLVLVGRRLNISIYNPKSIIDHSLRIEGLNLDKPHNSTVGNLKPVGLGDGHKLIIYLSGKRLLFMNLTKAMNYEHRTMNSQDSPLSCVV